LLAYSETRSDAAFRTTVLDHCKGSFQNFFEHQAPNGRLPILMTDRNADLLRSITPDAPRHANQAKPIFAQLAWLIARNGGGVDWVRPSFDRLLRFYDAWERDNLASCGLFVWGDDVAIGNDNDPTTFGRPFFSSANLLLNCLFYGDYKAATSLAQELNRREDAVRLNAKATALADRISSLCWDPRDRFFYTVDVQCVDHRAELLPRIKAGMRMSWRTLPLRIQTFTGFLPMWCGIATQQQAKQLVETNYLADERLRCESGVRTLSKHEVMYSLDFSSNPSNWLGPVWIISNYLVWKALDRYGYAKEARELAAKTLALLSKDIEANGSMNEYYHPDTGAALSHKGFMDWNLLVTEMIVPTQSSH
jgi:putative isomerase